MDISQQLMNTNLSVGQQQYLSIENKDILSDCTSASQVVYGNFSSCNATKREVIFLRSNDTLELYDITTDKFKYIANYHVPNAKIQEIASLKMTWKTKHLIVLHIQQDKLITLEYDEEIGEFKIFSMHNFENNNEVKASGKQYPLRGKLRSISSYYFSLVGYISDDNIFTFFELRQAVMPDAKLLGKTTNISQIGQASTQDIPNIGMTKKYNEQYLNVWGKDIESYLKPVRFFSLWETHKIQQIVDIQLVEMGQQNQCYLYVLHQANFDRTIGTITRQPISKLSVFEFVQQNKDSTDLNHILTIEHLSYYCRNIVKSLPSDDFVYVVGNLGVYVIRQEQQKFTYIQTTQMQKFLDDLDVPPSSKTMVAEEGVITVKNVLDSRSVEIKFDGATRTQALSGKRLLIMLEKGQCYIMHLIFDQAQIDVDDVLFTQITIDQPSIPSQILVLENQDQSQANIIVSSYYNDQSCYILKEKPKDVNLQNLDPSQRIRRQSEEGISYLKQKQDSAYEMHVSDTLPTISPITDILVQDKGDKDLEFICTSGNRTISYLTFVKEAIPYDTRLLNKDLQDIKRVYTIRDHNLLNAFDSHVVIAQDHSTSIMAVKPGNLEFLNFDNSGFIFNETTIQCLSVGTPNKILQITPSTLNLLSNEGILINSLKVYATETDPKIIAVSKEYLDKSDLIFILLSNGKMKCYQASTLKKRLQKSCQKLDDQDFMITAFSVAQIKDIININIAHEYLIVTYQKKGFMKIFQIDEQNDELSLVYIVKGITAQHAFLPNQLVSNKYNELLTRSEIHKEQIYVKEVVLKQIEDKIVLVMTLSSGMIICYENLNSFPNVRSEKFRFKLFQAQNLRSKIFDWTDHQYQLSDQILPQQIYIDDKQLVILSNTRQPLLLSVKRNKIFIHKFKHSATDDQTIDSISQFTQQGQPRGSTYLYVNQNSQTLNFLKIPPIFDPKYSPKVIDNYVIRQLTYTNKCVKKLSKFTDSRSNQDYLLVVSFSHVKAEYPTETPGSSLSAGMSEDQKAPGIQYELEVIMMPKDGVWRTYTQNFEPQMKLRQTFKQDEIVVNIEEARLLHNDNVTYHNYIAMSTIKIDSQVLEEGFYNSFLYLLDIDQKEKRLKICILEAFQGSITCLTHFQGRLIAVQKTQILREHSIVFYKFNEQLSKFDAKIQPQTVETQALHISFDGDYILVGDAYRNLGILWLCDEEELKRERMEDQANVIKLKYMYQNNIPTRVKGVYSLRVQPESTQLKRLNEVEKQMMSILTASEEGYLRIYQIREESLLECVAQFNIQDQINKIVPLPNSSAKSNLVDAKRNFLVMPKRGGILMVSTSSEQEHLGLESLMDMMSRTLPHRGGVAPIFAHKMPEVPLHYHQIIDPTIPRLNDMAIDKRSIGMFYFMNYNMQRAYSERIGYSVASINNYMCPEN
eukprot:403367821